MSRKDTNVNQKEFGHFDLTISFLSSPSQGFILRQELRNLKQQKKLRICTEKKKLTGMEDLVQGTRIKHLSQTMSISYIARSSV